MTSNHCTTNQVNNTNRFDRNSLSANYQKTPYSIIDVSNITPIARLLWIYLSSNDETFLPCTKVIAESLGVSKPTILSAKKLLQKHNMIEIEKVKNDKGGDKDDIYLLDQSEWIGVVFANKRSKPVGKKSLPTTGKKSLPTTGKKSLPFNREKKINKKIEEKSIYQDDKITGEDMKSKLADHEFRKELKQNAQTKAEKLQKIRVEVSTLEKKLAAKESNRPITREEFVAGLPHGSVDTETYNGIRKALSSFNLEGSPNDFRKALHLTFRLYNHFDKKTYLGVMERLRDISQDSRVNLTCVDYANLAMDGFIEKWSVSIFDYLILGAKPIRVKSAS